MTRRFEFVGGNSAKFWEINVTGCTLTVHFGRLGTEGQVQEKTFPTAEAATRHAEKIIGEKVRKGYCECAVR